MKKKYYDPEYDRMVDESEIRRQYDWFSQQAWFDKTYEQFKADNFPEAGKGQKTAWSFF